MAIHLPIIILITILALVWALAIAGIGIYPSEWDTLIIHTATMDIMATMDITETMVIMEAITEVITGIIITTDITITIETEIIPEQQTDMVTAVLQPLKQLELELLQEDA